MHYARSYVIGNGDSIIHPRNGSGWPCPYLWKPK